jgi:hypothetical protein
MYGAIRGVNLHPRLQRETEKDRERFRGRLYRHEREREREREREINGRHWILLMVCVLGIEL